MKKYKLSLDTQSRPGGRMRRVARVVKGKCERVVGTNCGDR